MTLARARFQEMLNHAANEKENDRSDRAAFRDECHRKFSTVWKAIDEAKREIRARNLGNVRLANVTPNTDRFEIIYNFVAKSGDTMTLKFQFVYFSGSDTVAISESLAGAGEGKAKYFSSADVASVVDHVLAFAAAFYSQSTEH